MSLEITTAEMPAQIQTPYGQQGDPNTHGAQEKPLRLVVAALRGRYHWAVSLALILGSICAAIGWYSGKQIYRSGVPLKVSPILQRVLYADEEKGQMPEFDRFVETEMALMQSQPVVEGAVDRLAKDPGWHSTHVDGNVAKTDTTILQLAANLSIIRNNELVMVYVLDPDPHYATLGAQTIVDTFWTNYMQADSQEEANRLKLLQTYESTYTNDRQLRLDKIASLTEPFKTQNIEEVSQNTLLTVNNYRSRLSNLKYDLILAGGGTKDGEKSRFTSIEQLAAADSYLAKLMNSRDTLQDDLSVKSVTLGSQHPLVLSEQAQLDRVLQRISDRVKELRENPQLIPLVTNHPGDAIVQDPQLIKSQIAEVSGLLDAAENDLKIQYKASTEVTALRDEIKGLEKNIDDAHQRRAQLELESRVGGRISVLGEAERPLQPFTDTRKKFATMGGVGGAFGGLMLVVVFGLMDRRLRHADEIGLRLGLHQILGMLPTLPIDLSDPEQAAITAHAVHHIRTMLQIRARERHGTPVLVITSPTSGTGKTSLVQGLGLSFASTGSRTLLIDCDIVGGGLTSRMNTILKRKIGRILIERKLITEGQLQTALRDTQSTNQRLGERLVKLGYLSEAHLKESLLIQNQPNAGLLEALRGVPLDKCVVKSGLPGLWVLPLSGADPHHASSLSPSAIGALFKEARRHFDTILVDTGPVPGSLEASIAAAKADGVIAIIARGESRNEVEKCLNHLRTVGASLLGIVFNRANEADMATRGTTKRISSTLRESHPQMNSSAAAQEQHRVDFGPVARAVASTASSSNGSRRHSKSSKTGNSK